MPDLVYLRDRDAFVAALRRLADEVENGATGVYTYAVVSQGMIEWEWFAELPNLRDLLAISSLLVLLRNDLLAEAAGAMRAAPAKMSDPEPSPTG